MRLGSAHQDAPPQDSLVRCSTTAWTNDTIVYLYQEERPAPPPAPPAPSPPAFMITSTAKATSRGSECTPPGAAPPPQPRVARLTVAGAVT